MSRFLGHEPCPICRSSNSDRSGDNLGVWEDHKYCFSCGYFEGNTGFTSLKRIADNNNQQKALDDLSVTLPPDCVDILPSQATEWLNKYDLTKDEMSTFLWSPSFERLIYPVYDIHQNLNMYIGRKFASDGLKHSKYHIQGKPEKIYHILGELSTEIVVVEDIISAIKVGRHTQVMPLWGANMSPERIQRLSGMFFRLRIWLDKDKAEYSLKTRLKASPYFDQVRSIITDKDPKDYNDTEIKEILE